MAVMHGAIDPRVPFPTGPTMLVSGPLLWDGDTAGQIVKATKIRVDKVVVTQDDARAFTDRNEDWDRPRAIAGDHWPAKLDIVSGTFVRGQARAIVNARVRLANGADENQVWDHLFLIGT